MSSIERLKGIEHVYTLLTHCQLVLGWRIIGIVCMRCLLRPNTWKFNTSRSVLEQVISNQLNWVYFIFRFCATSNHVGYESMSNWVNFRSGQCQIGSILLGPISRSLSLSASGSTRICTSLSWVGRNLAGSISSRSKF